MSSKYTVHANPNPYAPPVVIRNLPGGGGVAQQGGGNNEKIRRENLAHESAIVAFGWFFAIGGALSILGAGISFLSLLFSGGDFHPIFPIFVFGVQGTFALVQTVAGLGLRQLRGSSRIFGSLLAIPLALYGIGIWFFILVWSSKGNFIFSDEYKAVVEATPYIKRHMTVTAWILIFLPIVLTLIIFGILLLLGLIVIAASAGA